MLDDNNLRMKKNIIALSVCFCLSFFLTSCSSDFEQRAPHGLKSSLTISEMESVNEELMKYVTPPSSRVIEKDFSSMKLNITEAQAKDVCSPYLNDGKKLQSQMLRDMKIEGASVEDIQYVKNLSEEQVAMLSFAISNIQISSQTSTRAVSRNHVLRCIWTAIGIPISIDGYIAGTASLAGIAGEMVSWKFALKLCRTMALRYVGFIGAAVCIYDFMDCM